MRLVGEKRQKVYTTFEDVYFDVTDCSFSWKQGEKSKVIDIFTCVSETLGIRDVEKYEEVKEVFRDYLKDQIQDWFDWDKGSRENLIGFVKKKENIELFVKRQEFEEAQEKAESKDIAGTDTNDEWDW